MSPRTAAGVGTWRSVCVEDDAARAAARGGVKEAGDLTPYDFSGLGVYKLEELERSVYGIVTRDAAMDV